jgi:hypothetical protein
MDYRTLAAQLTKFIAEQEDIAGLWDGNKPGQVEENALTASYLIRLAQPLLDTLKELVADEDFVPPAK